MDYILLIAVLASMIVLGMVISVGNERQRKAIEEVRKEIEDWATQFVYIKRQEMQSSIKIQEPDKWFEHILSRLLGQYVAIEAMDKYQKEQILAVLLDASGGGRFLVTPVAPKEFIQAAAPKKKKNAALSGYQVNLLGEKPHKVPVYTLSVLNQGMLFDLEAQKVWKALFDTEFEFDKLYVFDLRP